MRHLSEVELHSYVVGRADTGGDVERHLESCTSCREDLASVLQLLNPDPQDQAELEVPASDEEVGSIYRWVRQIHAQENAELPTQPRHWSRNLLVAAAVLLAVALTTVGLNRLLETKRSNNFYTEGRVWLERIYAAESPSGLRLDLPFRSSATQRRLDRMNSLQQAEAFFYQSLGARQDHLEARLGLAYVFMDQAQFVRAREEFKKILGLDPQNRQARLGQAAAMFEEGQSAADPLEQIRKLELSLSDFEKLSSSTEARYNAAVVLFELGRHPKALSAIDSYLEHDPDSIWAQRLKELRKQIQLRSADNVEEAVFEAAVIRDEQVLATIAYLVPYQVPKAIRDSLKKSLVIDRASARDASGSARMGDLLWAAQKLESAYAATTGDVGYTRLLEFYADLSAPERRLKRQLDQELREIIDLQSGRDYETPLLESPRLTREFRRLEDHWQLVNIHHLRGNCFYFGRSDFESALSEYTTMFEHAVQSGATDLVARAHWALSSGSASRGRPEEALAHLVKLEELATKSSLDTLLSSALTRLGRYHMQMNQPDEGLGKFSQALKLALRLADELVILESLRDSGDAMARLGRSREARGFYRQATNRMDLAETDPTALDPTNLWLWLDLRYRLAQLELELGNWRAAEFLFRECLSIDHKGINSSHVRTRLGLAEVYIQTDQLNPAAEELAAAAVILRSGEHPSQEWKAKTLEARLLVQSGQPVAARARFVDAIELLDRVRSRMPMEEMKQPVALGRLDPFPDIVSLLYETESDKKKAHYFSDRAKSAALRESLSFHSEPSVPLPPGLAVVDFFVGQESLFVFVSSSSWFDSVRISVGPAQLEDWVAGYLTSLQDKDQESQTDLARRLYDLLLQPALGPLEMDQIEVLVLIPDGPLHRLPFAALRDSSGAYLLEKCALAYAPSQSILSHLLSLRTEDTSSRRVDSVLLLGGTPNLKGASGEIAHLAKTYGERAALAQVHDLATLRRRVAEADIIHFSGHATEVMGKPSLVVKGTRGRLHVRAAEIREWDLRRSHLVTLAGCNTGIAGQVNRESPNGLLTALLNARASSMLVSLMELEDLDTQRLTAEFYRLLEEGPISKSEALRRAQLSILRTGPNPHPASWAPFALVGNPL